MHVLGLTAPQKHGKSTFGELAQEIDPTTFLIETSTVISEVADGMHQEIPSPPQESIVWLNSWIKVLPGILRSVVRTDNTYEDLSFTTEDAEKNVVLYEKLLAYSHALHTNPDLANHRITDHNKAAYRPLLQWLGNYLIEKVSPTIWYDEIFRRVETAQNDGSRFAIIGGLRYVSDEKAVRAHGGIIIDIFRPGMPTLDVNDPTERERSKIIFDTRLINGGNRQQYKRTVEQLLQDIAMGSVQKEYVSHP